MYESYSKITNFLSVYCMTLYSLVIQNLLVNSFNSKCLSTIIIPNSYLLFRIFIILPLDLNENVEVHISVYNTFPFVLLELLLQLKQAHNT